MDDTSDDENNTHPRDAASIYYNQKLQNFKQIMADREYKKIQKSIKQNRFNLLKWATYLVEGALWTLFSIVFRIIGVVLATTALPFGKWKKVAAKNRFKNVYGVFDTIACVLQGLIMIIINGVVRCLLCPHWWYTVASTAKEHANEHNIGYKKALGLCVAESFITIVEASFSQNFGDIAPLNQEHRRSIDEATVQAVGSLEMDPETHPVWSPLLCLFLNKIKQICVSY